MRRQLKSTSVKKEWNEVNAKTPQEAQPELRKEEVTPSVFMCDDKLLGKVEPIRRNREGEEEVVDQAISGIHLDFDLDGGDQKICSVFPILDPFPHPVIASKDELAQEASFGGLEAAGTLKCSVPDGRRVDSGFDTVLNGCATSPSVAPAVHLRLLSDDAAPEWTVRPHIKTGYRNEMSWRQCIASLFVLHNEAGNVWTHLVGFLVYSYLLVWEIASQDKTPAHLACSIGFLVSSLICMALSVNFHLMTPHSKDVYERTLRFDLTGVGICISSSLVVGMVYGFWCHTFLGTVYLSIVGVLSFVALLWPHNPKLLENYKLTQVFFSMFTAFALIPLIHWVVIVGGFSSEEGRIFFWRCILIFVLYGIGFAFYAKQMPEKMFPGVFDNFLHSHQIWHLFVLGGGLMCYCTIQTYAAFREAHPCQASGG